MSSWGDNMPSLVKNQREALGVRPGDWMFEGMTPCRAEWLERVLVKLTIP